MAGSAEAGKERAKAECESPGLVSDCRLMLSFARKNGFVLPPSLLHEIAWLDSVLRGLEIAPVSQVSPQLIWPIDATAGQPQYAAHDPEADTNAPPPVGMVPEEVILDVHSKLSVLITPTTALSLQTSEPPAGRRHIFGGMPPLVQVVIVVAFLSAVCFVISASQIAGKDVRWKARKAAEESAASAAAAAAATAAAFAASQGAMR
jgi:hypothetical protein